MSGAANDLPIPAAAGARSAGAALPQAEVETDEIVVKVQPTDMVVVCDHCGTEVSPPAPVFSDRELNIDVCNACVDAGSAASLIRKTRKLVVATSALLTHLVTDKDLAVTADSDPEDVQVAMPKALLVIRQVAEMYRAHNASETDVDAESAQAADAPPMEKETFEPADTQRYVFYAFDFYRATLPIVMTKTSDARTVLRICWVNMYCAAIWSEVAWRGQLVSLSFTAMQNWSKNPDIVVLASYIVPTAIAQHGESEIAHAVAAELATMEDGLVLSAFVAALEVLLEEPRSSDAGDGATNPVSTVLPSLCSSLNLLCPLYPPSVETLVSLQVPELLKKCALLEGAKESVDLVELLEFMTQQPETVLEGDEEEEEDDDEEEDAEDEP